MNKKNILLVIVIISIFIFSLILNNNDNSNLIVNDTMNCDIDAKLYYEID